MLAGETPAPLLTRSVSARTGELHWFLTKATPLVDAGGEELAVNVIEDVTEEQEAALRCASWPRPGGARLLARRRRDAAAGRPARRAADGRLVRDRAARRERAAPAGRARPRRPALVETGRAMRERWPPQPDAPSSPYEVLRTGAAQLLAEVPDALLEAASTTRSSSRRSARSGSTRR